MTGPNFKTPAIRDRAWLDQVRDFPCLICGFTPCDPAHIRHGLGGGMAMKPGDNLVVPLCNNHHQEQHRVGEVRFWSAAVAEDPALLMRALKSMAQLLYIERKGK